jgi:hypothetical protein
MRNNSGYGGKENMKSARPLSSRLGLLGLAAAAALCSFGCSRPAPPQHNASPEARQAQEQMSLKYAKYYIGEKNYEEAVRFVDSIPADSTRASEVAALRTEIEKLSADYDQALNERYTTQKSVPINLTAELKSCNSTLNVEGHVLLPRRTRLMASLWREENGTFSKVAEELVEVGPASRYEAVFKINFGGAPTPEAWQKMFANKFEVRLNSCFRSASDQPSSVMKLVGAGGEKITGDWVEERPEGKCINFHQQYNMESRATSDHCLYVKPNKI